MLGFVPQAAICGGAGAGRPRSKPTWIRTGTAGFAPLPANQPGHPGAVVTALGAQSSRRARPLLAGANWPRPRKPRSRPGYGEAELPGMPKQWKLHTKAATGPWVGSHVQGLKPSR